MSPLSLRLPQTNLHFILGEEKKNDASVEKCLGVWVTPFLSVFLGRPGTIFIRQYKAIDVWRWLMGVSDGFL